MGPRAGPEGRGIKPRTLCFHFIAPETIKGHLLSTYNTRPYLLRGYLIEPTLQMHYHLHSADEETGVKRLLLLPPLIQ